MGPTAYLLYSAVHAITFIDSYSSWSWWNGTNRGFSAQMGTTQTIGWQDVDLETWYWHQQFWLERRKEEEEHPYQAVSSVVYWNRQSRAAVQHSSWGNYLYLVVVTNFLTQDIKVTKMLINCGFMPGLLRHMEENSASRVIDLLEEQQKVFTLY